MVLLKVYSDNTDGELLTVEAYEELAVQMSTGDCATHRVEVLVCPEKYAPTHIMGWETEEPFIGEPIVFEGDNEEWHPARIGGK